jgi:tetratricopeptide (TPR) repeat protein
MADSTLPAKERRPAAINALKDFVAAYPDARLSPYAWMYLAQIYWADENLAEARQAFRKAQAHDGATEFTRRLALIGEAKLDEADRKFKQSAERYANLPDKPFSDLKAYNLGRLAAANQRPKEARVHFEKVLNQFPPSRLTQWANEAMSFLP